MASPKLIEVGNDVIEFPSDMSDEEIRQILEQQYSSPKQQTQPVQTPKTQPSMWEEFGRQLGLTARAGVTGVTSLPAMLADPAVSLFNKLTGSNVTPTSEAVQQTLTAMGLPEPKNGLERAVQAGAGAMAGVGGQAALASKAATPYLKPLTEDLLQQTVAAGTAGTAAKATADRAQEVGYSPASTVAASLATGTLAGVLGAKAAGPTARAVSTVKGKITGEPATKPITMESVKASAQKSYTKVEDSGVMVKPKPVLDTLDSIETKLYKDFDFNPLLETHKPVKIILDDMKKMVGSQKLSFTKLDQLRQKALNLARESKEPATRRLAGYVVQGIDDRVTSLQPMDLIAGKGQIGSAINDIKDARQAWKNVSKATILEDALNVAAARALDPKASEGELIRRQFINLVADKNKMRMFTKEEQAAIKRATTGSGARTILSLLARFNPERSQLMLGSQVYLGAQTSPTAALGVAGTGYASDKTLAFIQRKAADDVLSQILSGKIKQPDSIPRWRALIEAKTNEYLKNNVTVTPENQEEPVYKE